MADNLGRAELRAVVEELARFCCDYCRYPQKYTSDDRLPMDHILPGSRGGPTELGNMALCCSGRNNHKYDHMDEVDPETGQLVPLFHPRQQRWGDHFRWSADLLKIEGRTATGRATIERLKMNRSGPINLRRSLLRDGEHPPLEPVPHH